MPEMSWGLKRSLLPFALAGAAWLAPPPAFARDFGTVGQGIVGFENLATTTDGKTPFDGKRLGFDYLIGRHLSFGGSVSYAHTSLSAEDNRGETKTLESSSFTIEPRLGWAQALGQTCGLWIRGGVTYYAVGDLSGMAWSLDPALLVFVSEHVAFSMGVTLNADSTHSAHGNSDSTVTGFGSSYGLTFGLHGVF